MSKELEDRLAKTKHALQLRYGNKTVMMASEIPRYEVVSSGSIGVNYVTGIGGFPTNRVIEIAGKPAVGKTTLTMLAVKNFLLKFPDKACLYIDAENRVTPEWMEQWVGPELMPRVIMCKPDSVEEATFVYTDLVPSGDFCIAVFDSIGGTPSKKRIEAQGQTGFDSNAMAITKFAQFAQTMAGKYNCCTIGINQVREDMSGYNQLITPGGAGWKHATSLRIHLVKGKDKMTDKVDGAVVQVGGTVVAKVVKNSLAPPYMSCYYWFYWRPCPKGYGVDQVEEVQRFGVLTDVIAKPGANTHSHPLFPNGKITSYPGVWDFLNSNQDVTEKLSIEIGETLKGKKVEGIGVSFDPDAGDSVDTAIEDLQTANRKVISGNRK